MKELTLCFLQSMSLTVLTILFSRNLKWADELQFTQNKSPSWWYTLEIPAFLLLLFLVRQLSLCIVLDYEDQAGFELVNLCLCLHSGQDDRSLHLASLLPVDAISNHNILYGDALQEACSEVTFLSPRHVHDSHLLASLNCTKSPISDYQRLHPWAL